MIITTSMMMITIMVMIIITIMNHDHHDGTQVHPNPLGKQIGATFFHELPIPPPPPAPRVVVGAEAVKKFLDI